MLSHATRAPRHARPWRQPGELQQGRRDVGQDAILLQARGVGLSGTFGGDSAVYRSRRGVERRLWQFTIVLLVLFIIFSLAAFILAPAVTT